jgi:hypothetical protein
MPRTPFTSRPRWPLYEQSWPDGDYRLFQLGFVSDGDLVADALRWVEVFGVGPFHVLGPIEAACTHRGEASGITIEVAVAQAGPVQIELIAQRCARPSVFREWRARHAGALHQLCTITSEYDSKRAQFERLGYEVATEILAPDGQRVAFVDTVGDFGFFTEIVDATPGFVGGLVAMARTCAEWDGVDPVRIVTREGYRTPEP